MSIEPQRPIKELAERALTQTHELMAQAAAFYAIETPPTQVRFDLRGQAAGQARCPTKGPALIRYNSVLLTENAQRFLARTVPHEVAHVIAYRVHGPRIRPHGAEWRRVMDLFGADSSRCHDYDVSRSRVRRLNRYVYHCDCREYALTSIRHKRVLLGQTYYCRSCKKSLKAGNRQASPS